MEARKKTTHSQLPNLFQYIEPYISQNHSSVTKLIIVFMDYRRTFLLHIYTLAYVKAGMLIDMLRNIHFSYIVQNRSGVVMFTYAIYEC